MRFSVRFRVGAADIDALGHVNNVVYVGWVQDVAAAHWRSATSARERDSLVWVAVRHEIDYLAPAFADEEIEARTWVEGWSGVTSDRRTEILRPADGTTLARARTLWCAVDPATLRPTRLDARLKGRFSEE